MEIKLKLNCLPDLTMIEITKQLFNNEFLSDIQFQVNGKVLYAHSLEIMKRSIVFQKQLMLNLGEKKLIPVEDVKYESFYKFLQFIYTDECKVDDADMGIDMLKLAVKYQVIRLENILIDWLTDEPMCLRLYELCLLEKYRVPHNRIKMKVANSLSKCLAHDSFKMIHADVVEEILKFDHMNADTPETELFGAIIRWMNNYCENNGISLESCQFLFRRFLELIRFPTMELNEFVSCYSKIGSFLTENDCGIIFKLIVDNTLQSNNSKWISIPRKNFSWRMKCVVAIAHLMDDDRFITNFTVTNDVFLAGIWFGNLSYQNKNIKCNLQLTARNIETQSTEIIIFQCYESENFGCSLNSLGDSVILRPNNEYSMHILCSNEEIGKFEIYCRTAANEIIITDPSKSVQIRNAAINIFEMIFETPT